MTYEGMNCYEGKEESNVALHYYEGKCFCEITVVIQYVKNEMDVNELLAIAQSNATIPDENTEELIDSLLSLLPPLKDFSVESVVGSTESFVAKFSADLKTEEDVDAFLEKYSSVTQEVLRIAKNV